MPVGLALGCGIAIGRLIPGSKGVEIFCCALLFTVLVMRVLHELPLGIVPAVLFFAVGHCLIQFTVWPVFSENHIVNFCDQKAVWVQGRIASVPVSSNRRIRFELRVEQAGTTRSTAKAAVGKLRLSVYSPCPDLLTALAFNDCIGCSSPLREIRNFNNPGGFDYRGYMGLKGIYCTGWVKGNALVRLPQSRKFQPICLAVNLIQACRRQFGRHIRQNVENQNAAAVLTALVTGNRQWIDQDLGNLFSRAGANHILAISGLHLSIVALVSFNLFNRLFSVFPLLVISGVARKLAAVFTLVPLIFYALLSGFSPSTQRAFTMVAMVMVCLAVEKEADTVNALAAAFIAILIIWPGALFSISFQLSFFAVLFILGGMAVVKKLTADTDTGGSFFNRAIKRVGMFMAVSLFAILGTQPLVMHYFNQISFAGIFTNLILIPGAGFLALPLGLLALFVYPFFVGLSALLVALAGFILGFCIDFLGWVSALSMAWSHAVTPDFVEISCYYLFCFGLFMVFKNMKKRGVLLVVAAFVIFSAREYFLILDRFFNKNVNVFVLDVGQGSAALIEAPQGKRVLIDGGGFSRFSTFDTGERIVAPFLWFRKILTLDAVVLTHPESDHMNGLIYIMDNFKVGRFIKNSEAGKKDNYRDLMAVVEHRRIRVEIVPGLERLNLGDAQLEFLYPLGQRSENANNNSIVSKLTHGNISVLFPGDIMNDAEKEIVRVRGKRLLSTVLVSPHHGSSSSSGGFFLDQVRPKSVIISCGFKNRYGFPHAAVIERYTRRGYRLFETGLAGAVQIISTGSCCEIMTSKGNKFCFISTSCSP
ncbi:ComE [Desulforapulum autotrophicum HRM2]|uniref:ComE n=1 Tax=Desulforapulum autotrophicum (strain ATCC 43914 / DSM 3382 / VKM B-1955 / HRM2) TaxID=177437 RepID=C0QDM8_DESAH|nr:ComE [Desulforapulum autotrophicum HRM2]